MSSNYRHRPCWPELWMNIAEKISDRSHDPRLRVGAIVVPDDNTGILALGYNGDERGGPNVPDSMEPGGSGFLHGEINTLIKLNPSDHRVKTMYVTHFPCRTCCRAIVNAGINTVVYVNTYRDMSGREILDRSNVRVMHIDEAILIAKQ